MTKKQRHKRRKQYSLPKAGSSPGLVYIDPNALDPIINIYKYNADHFSVEELGDLKRVAEIIADKNYTYWIQIKGFGSIEMFETLNIDFNINKLILEDITRTYQRPKLEEYDDYVFAISRMLRIDDNNDLDNVQVSYILTDNALFSFQESHQDCLDPVITRLKAGKGNIRTAGSSYIMYALMDIIVDTYFEILQDWGEELDTIEDRLFEKPDKSVMYDTQMIKRNLIGIRRVVWPERDKLNDILRSDSPLISDQTKLFVKDAYDHCIQIIDIVESLKEISVSNIDMYLSVISNRMNEIMKVLTVISSIFIPLTFIAGIYGMNFAYEDPVTGKIMPKNMPELYQENGYLYIMLFMGAIAFAQILYFWRKGWFK
ncbi:magnesium/cobalt transporter CorA [Pedobacter metabolipauper]|uniref:Magnesium transport protein CorA n=1 Tax=Pedobacter metabolipauper TaxID=425513 RepID=A0A4R6T1X7_9SPHI|nr:magnesium/cobalt transporter CorA [Pedobacter metabolipauper]TDQ11678.1 magnesium transporter [Pedobacter metabolipauper]